MKILNSKKYLYGLAGLIAAGSCLAMVAFPGVAMNSAEKGVALWASSVLPALLPFFICVNFMTKLGLPRIIGKAFERPFRMIFGAPGVSAFIFTVSITSGYPMGAKIIGDMGRAGNITKNEAKQMLTFCTTSGPLFMLGAVGAGLLNSPAAGLVIAISHYLGAVLNGILYRLTNLFKRNKFGDFKHSIKIKNNQEKRHDLNLLEMFTDAILSSLKSLGIICGYLVLFTMLTDFMVFSGMLKSLPSFLVPIIKGLFEMTVGCSSMAETSELSLVWVAGICTFLISFGGISIIAQSMSMMSGLGISTIYYTKVKLTHGIISFVLAMVIGPVLIGQELLETSLTLGPVKEKTDMLLQNFSFMGNLDGIYCLFFSTKMVIMVTIILVAIMLIEGLNKDKINDNSRNNS